MDRIILASGSPRRRELLDQIGIPFEVCVSNKEEITTKTLPEDIVKELSSQKAEDVMIMQKETEDFVIIAADTMVAYQNNMLGKPKDEQDATDMIRSLQGNTHQVYTGVTILVRKNGTLVTSSFTEKTEVEMWDMTEEQIKEYVYNGQAKDKSGDFICDTVKPWQGKAGAYGIQDAFGAKFIKGIKGDYYNVVGLPVSHLYRELQRLGVSLL